MSAWIVSKAHIDLLITAGLTFANAGRGPLLWNKSVVPQPGGAFDPNHLNGPSANEVGRMLWAANQLSVAARYPGEDPDQLPGPADFTASTVAGYEFSRIPGAITPIVVLKSISCFEYQSGEHEGWANSEARSFCLALASVCTGMLPGYTDAPWGFDDPQHFVH